MNVSPKYMAHLSASVITPNFAYYMNSSGRTMILTAMHDVINQGQITDNGTVEGPVPLDEVDQRLDCGRGGVIDMIALYKIINAK